MNTSLSQNGIYVRRRSNVFLPEPSGREPLPLNCVTTVMKEMERLGFTFSERLIHACRALALDQLTDLYRQLVSDCEAAKGAHQKFTPMYPNFPEQVMRMDEADLYFNAIVHYLSGGKLRPRSEKQRRLPLLDSIQPQVIDVGSQDDFEALFGQIAASNASLSEQDREDLLWFVVTYGDGIERLLPGAVPQKETVAFLAGLLMAHTSQAEPFVARFCKTATDVLRIAVALSGGDVSLAKSTKFRTFTRPERRLLLSLVDGQANATEDMLRWKGRWLRLGERLHPGEYAGMYPNAAAAFAVLRRDTPFPTFNGQVETALAAGKVAEAVANLSPRAGDFARRLDHVLRVDESRQAQVLAAFALAAPRVSTPVLLQVRTHFQSRNRPSPLRVFFPKGSLAKAHAEPNGSPALHPRLCASVADVCADALLERFRALPPLGRVYVDPKLSDYMVPFSARSASRSFRTVARGSRLPLPVGCQTLRFFVWWKNGRERTDIDLSAALFDGDFGYRDVVSYYNLNGYGGVHSGDIVDAPNGASEFIDIPLDRVREQGIRYVVMTLSSYTQQPYAELPECFAGWMAREKPGSGEVYDPRTVQDRLDLTAEMRIAVPLIIDVVECKVVWCDMALRNHPRWQNNVDGNLGGIATTLQSLVDLRKPSLYEDLFALQAEARGERVDAPEAADVVFSVERGTPYRQEEIAAEYLLSFPQ